MKVEKSSNIAKKPVEVDGAKGAEMRLLISKADGAENFAMPRSSGGSVAVSPKR